MLNVIAVSLALIPFLRNISKVQTTRYHIPEDSRPTRRRQIDWGANGEDAYIWQAAAEGTYVLSMHSTFGNEKTPTTID
jgi:hypothetical protein